MVESILNTAEIKNKEVRFLTEQSGTYAVWFDEYDVRGADDRLCIKEHACSIELYSDQIDRDAEQRLEAQFALRKIEFQKSMRTWISDERLFQVVYSFDYIEKGVINNG